MKKTSIIALGIALSIWACKETPLSNNLEHIAYAPSSYTVVPPTGFPAMEIPADNPMTVEGISLGRHLFYDPIMSGDSTISCSSCHQLDKAFTDGLAKAEGVNHRVGRRSTMSLINIGYSWIKNRDKNFMWDGRFARLEDQPIAPVEDPNEMDFNWPDLVKRLQKHPEYPRMFREAFGISDTREITKYLASKAIAQFERTLNSANSKYDRDRWVAFDYMTQQQKRGFDLFLGDAANNPITKDAECVHCHSFSDTKALFARNNFSNNGLDSAASFNDFVDKGYGEATGDYTQNGLFKEVTLRNIALTAPYMHDGRFATLREVVDHYASGGHASPNVAPELTTATELRTLTNSEKDDLVAFLHALTDTTLTQHEEWKSPF